MSWTLPEYTGHLILSHWSDNYCILKMLSQEAAGEEGKTPPHKKEP